MKKALSSGLIGACLGAIGSFCVNYFLMPVPDTIMGNAIGNAISGAFSGLLGGFVPMLIASKIEKSDTR